MPKVYKTISGDTWDIISMKHYKSEYYIRQLIEANTDKRHIVVFPANESINIPDIDIAKVSSSLPPWKAAK